jgi:hypothetical protein
MYAALASMRALWRVNLVTGKAAGSLRCSEALMLDSV